MPLKHFAHGHFHFFPRIFLSIFLAKIINDNSKILIFSGGNKPIHKNFPLCRFLLYCLLIKLRFALNGIILIEWTVRCLFLLDWLSFLAEFLKRRNNIVDFFHLMITWWQWWWCKISGLWILRDYASWWFPRSLISTVFTLFNHNL